MHCTENVTVVSTQQKGWDKWRWLGGGGVTWWLLWLIVEIPWLAMGGQYLALVAQMGLKNTTLIFLAVKATYVLTGG